MRLFLYFIFFFSAIISSTPSYSIDELSNYREKCETLGFSKGTEKFGNCVMKLLEELPSLKINFVKYYDEKSRLMKDTMGDCEAPRIVRGKKVYLYILLTEKSKCPKYPQYFSGYLEKDDGTGSIVRAEIRNGAYERWWYLVDGFVVNVKEFQDGLLRKEKYYNSLNKQLEIVIRYKDGIKHGLYENYWDTTIYTEAKEGLRQIGEYMDDKRIGTWKRYNWKGEVYSIKTYRDGNLVSEDCIFGKQSDGKFCSANNR